MTNEEIINMFPECEYIKKEDIVPIITYVMNEIKYYGKIGNYIYDECKKFFPESHYPSEEYTKYFEYFYGTYDKETKIDNNPFGDWVESIKKEFFKRKGVIRSYEEACKIATDKWIELIFGFHIQDNGAINENHPGGFASCALGTVLKNKVIGKYIQTNKYIDKVKELIEHWYLNDYQENNWCELSCDYGPNTYLDNILVKAGINEKDTSSICPWKTRIGINFVDNSVEYYTYQHVEFI